jgi:iron(III) transport system substrate-binding protein
VRAAFALLAAVCVLPVAGCGRSGGGDDADGRPAAPVVVYVASEDDAFPGGSLKGYQDETGVIVDVRRGTADSIVEDLIMKRVEPPADVLVTRSVADVQRAAAQGALRPLAAAGVELSVPAWLRDPDGFWAGFGGRIAVIAFDPRATRGGAGTDYAALADSVYADRLCLSSSGIPVNRAVIAQLIAAQGVRPAELVVRGWLANLARPVFESEAELLDAIAGGECAIGIVSSAASPETRTDLAVTVPTPAFADADAIGIGRHARNPDGAAAFVEWLLAREAKRLPDTAGHDTRLATWYVDDAVKLAERAHYP